MFFALAKIATFLVQPSGLVLVGVIAAVVGTVAGRPRLARTGLGLALVILLAALSPLPNVLILPLEQRFPRASLEGAPITGFVILGGGEDADVAFARGTHALNEAGERVSEAVALARRLPEARVVFSGGSGRLVPGRGSESAAMTGMLTAMGIAPERLTVEDLSRDTHENARLTRDLVRPPPQAGERWLLLTSAYHMPRAIGVFRAAGWPMEAWPVDYRTAGWSDATAPFFSTADGLRRLDLVAKELAGLVAYRLSGRTDVLWPGP